MPVIRIDKQNYERLKERAVSEDRPLSRVVTRLLNDALKPIAKGNPQLKKKPVHPLFHDFKTIYCETWEKNNGLEYRWNGVIDATATTKLIKELEALNKSDGPATDLFRIIMDRLPDFYKDKSLNAIKRNLNGIIAEIKRGNTSGNQAAVNHYGL